MVILNRNRCIHSLQINIGFSNHFHANPVIEIWDTPTTRELSISLRCPARTHVLHPRPFSVYLPQHHSPCNFCETRPFPVTMRITPIGARPATRIRQQRRWPSRSSRPSRPRGRDGLTAWPVSRLHSRYRLPVHQWATGNNEIGW